ncbi:MAG: hypothetical protein ACYC23_23605, partial [Limisphaerales bacterium]
MRPTIEHSSPWETAQNVWAAEAAGILALRSVVEPGAFNRCVEVLAGCPGRILTTGCGTSAAAARKIAHSLCCI